MLRFCSFLRENRNEVLGLEYHEGLADSLWKDDKLSPELRKPLIKIAHDWTEFLGFPLTSIEDITFTGSAANYNFTNLSDIDLHVIADPSKIGMSEDTAHDYIMHKKKEWGLGHPITFLAGFPVEVYTQLDNEPFTAGGVYSVLHDHWIKHPINLNLDFENRYDLVFRVMNYVDQIENLTDVSTAKALWHQIKDLRAYGLRDRSDEFADENLIFKSLRNNGSIAKLVAWIAQHETAA